MKKLRIAVVAAVMALCTGSVAAQPFGHGGHMDVPMRGAGDPTGAGPQMGELSGVHRMLGALELTEEQREQIRDIVDEARREVRAIMDRVRARDHRQEFLEVFTDPDMTAADLDAVFNEMKTTRDQIREIMIEAIVDIHDVLTEEQLQRIMELAESRAHWGDPGPHF